MDQRAFDGLTRLVAIGVDRRSVLPILGAAALGIAGLVGSRPSDVAANKKGKRKKGMRKHGNEEPASSCKSKLAACTSDDFCYRRGLYVCVGGHCIEDADDRWWLDTCDAGCPFDRSCHGGFCRYPCGPGAGYACYGECIPSGDAGYCLDCTEDAHCRTGLAQRFCIDNFCSDCRSDADCPVTDESLSWHVRPGTPRTCRAGWCQPSCTSDADCETAYAVDDSSAKPLARSCVNGVCVWDLHKQGCAYGFQGGGGA